MSYERFIKKDGKVYGPYTYQSKRVDGKIVSSYVKPKGQRKSFNKSFIIILLVLVALAFTAIIFNQGISHTGNVTLQFSEDNIQLSEGYLDLILKEGELIPSNSLVKISYNSQVFEVPLSSLISSNSSQGNFYVEGLNLSGSGEGFGFVGQKKVSSDVFFTLLLSDEINETVNQTLTNETANGTVSEIVNETVEELLNESNSVPSSGENLSEEVNSSSIAESNVSEQSTNFQESPSNEPVVTEESPSPENPQESVQSEATPVESPQVDVTTQDESSSSESAESSDSGITGAVVGLGENSDEIQGRANAENSFEYSLNGRFATVKPGSVYSDSENLSEDVLALREENGLLIVSTNYSSGEKGFGSEFLGSIEKLKISLSQFNLSGNGTLTIQLIYENQTLAELTKEISVENKTNVTQITNQSFALLQNIGVMRIVENSNLTINLGDYFSGAEYYYISNVKNLSLSFSVNDLLIVPEENFTGKRKANLTAFAGNESINQIFVVDVYNPSLVSTKQYQAVVKRPVKWVKSINISNESDAIIEIPKEAENITIKTGDEALQAIADAENSSVELNDTPKENLITGNVISSPNRRGLIGSILAWFGITGNVIGETEVNGSIEETSTSKLVNVSEVADAGTVAVEYFTQAPEINESNLTNGKQVVIYAPSELNYTDILAYSLLDGGMQLPINSSRLHLYWNATYEDAVRYGYIKLNDSNDTELSEEIPSELIMGNLSESPENQNELNVSVNDSLPVESLNESLNETKLGEEISGGLITGNVALDVGSEESQNNTNEINTSRYVLVEVSYTPYDLDEDGNVDYIEWVVPHLSAQSYSITVDSSNFLTNTLSNGNYTHLSVNNSLAPYDSLKAYWSFDFNNATKAADLSGSGYIGTYAGNAVIGAGSPYGNALLLDGNADYVSSALNLSNSGMADSSFGNLSVSLWLKRGAVGSNQGLFSYANGLAGSCGTGNLNFAAWFSSSNVLSVRYYNNTQGCPFESSVGTIADTTTWHHIVVAFNGTGMMGYIDGVSTANNTLSSLNYNGSLALYIGSYLQGNPTTLGLNGAIDELMVFNTTLSKAQVSAIYNNQSARFVSSGNVVLESQNISVGFDKINVSFDDYQRNQNTNLSLRIGQWDPSLGYNNSDLNGNNGLVAYWNFDNTTNSQVGGINPTVNGGASYSFGRFNNSLNFNGTGISWLNISSPISNGLNIGLNNWSVSSWFYILDSTSNKEIIGKRDSSYGTGWDLYLSSTASWVVNNGTSNGYSAVTGGTIPSPITGTWHHVVGTLNRNDAVSGMKIYVDGTLAKTGAVNFLSTQDLTSSVTQVGIGRIAYTNSYAMNGSIDEIMVFNRTLTAAEVGELYNKGRALWNYTNYQNLSDDDTLYYSQNYGDSVSAWLDGVTDYKGLNNGSLTGTGVQSNWSSDVTKRNQTLQMNGTYGKYQQIPMSSTLNNSNVISFSAWIKPTVNSFKPEVITATNAGAGSQGYFLGFTGNVLLVYVRNSTSNGWATSAATGTSTASILNTWTHLVYIIDGVNNRTIAYRNGVLDINTTLVGGWNQGGSNPLRIGGCWEGWDCTTSFAGAIDEVAVWNRSLTLAEVKNIYLNSKPAHSNNQFSIATTTTNVLHELSLQSDSNLFYTPSVIATTYLPANATNLDSIVPLALILYPSNNSNFNSTTIQFNISTSDADPSKQCSWTNGTSNYTITGCANSSITLAAGYSNITLWVNDSSGNVNSSSVYNIYADSTAPTISVATPTNNSNYNSQGAYVNASASDVGGDTTGFVSDGLVSWYRMDDLNSTGGVVDYMSRFNGSVGLGSAQTDAGKFGKAFTFNGSSYINLGKPINYTSRNFTISLWTKRAVTGAFQGFYGGNANGGTPVMGRFTSGNAITFRVLNMTGSAFDVTTTTTVANTNWHHVALVRQGSAMRVYIDGAKDVGSSETKLAGNEIGGIPAGSNIYIGNDIYGNYFNGSIDDVIIFNRSLSDSEILALYNSSANRILYNKTDLVAGVNNINLYAQDFAGNVNPTTLTVNYNTTAPTLTITSPLNNSYYNSASYNLNASSSGSGDVSLFSTSGLVSWYRMDDLNSTGGVVDYMGRNNCSVFGNAAQTDAGKFGKAMRFDGTGDYIRAPGTQDTMDFGTTDFAISVWSYNTGSASSEGVVSKGSGSSGAGWNVEIDGPTGTLTVKLKGSLADSGWISVSGGLNQWTHWVMNVNRTGNNVTIYKNGVLGNSKDITGIGDLSNDYNLTIGARAGSTGTGVNGSIDDVMIFNRSLSVAEIVALYANSSSQYLNTSATGVEGVNIPQVYSQDSFGNLNSSSVNFSVDTLAPNINVTYPLAINYSINVSSLNYTVSDANLQSCWYSAGSSSLIDVSSATKTASTTYLTYVPSNAFDGNLGTFWWSSTSAPGQWLQVDLGAGNSKVVNMFSMYHDDIVSVSGNFSGSNDGSSWTTLTTFTHPTTLTFYNTSFVNSNSYRYYRVSFTSGSPAINWIKVHELQLYQPGTQPVSCGTNITGLTSNEGSNTWTVYANDSVGNTNSSSVTFFKDTIFPRIVILSPANNTNSSNNALSINYSASDLNLQSCWYSNDSSLVNNSLAGCANISGLVWSEGSHNVTIWVNDSSGNVNSSSVNFLIDTISPQLGIVFPQDEYTYNYHNQTLNYTVSDTNLKSCWKSLNGGANVTLSGCQNSTVNFGGAGTAEEQNNLTVWANDSAGNLARSSVEFYVHTSGPAISLVSPADDFILGNNSVNFSFIPLDAQGISYCELYGNWTGAWAKNETFVTPGNNSLTSSIKSISDGIYIWNVWCNDSLSNSAWHTDNHTFTVDTVNPVVNIVSLANGQYLNYNSSIALNYIISTNNTQACWYSIDSLTNISLPGCLNTTLGLAEGVHNVEVWINSTAGLVGRSNRNITIDTILPVVESILPDAGKSYTSSNQFISFVYNVSDLNIYNCSLKVNAQALNSTNTSIDVSLGATNELSTSLVPGSYVWNVACQDLAGNIGGSSLRSLTVSAPAAPEVPVVSRGGGGGGGVSVSQGIVLPGISIDTSEINSDMIVNSNKERIIKITNTGDSTQRLAISQTSLDGFVSFDKRAVEIAPGQSEDLVVTLIAGNKTGVFAGRILIDGHEILVSLNVRSKALLFDSLIVVPDEYKVINLGQKLSTQITLIPMGENPRLDVTLNYVIKDYSGKTLVSESETILVEGQKTFKKDFYTTNLPEGEYVVGLELVYPNGVATSSSHFSIRKGSAGIADIGLFIMLGLVAFVIVLIGIVAIRYKNHRRQILSR